MKVIRHIELFQKMEICSGTSNANITKSIFIGYEMQGYKLLN